MVNRRTVAALLVFATVAANGQTVPPTGGGCTPVAAVWDCTENKHQRGGAPGPNGTDTQAKCAKACNDNPACTGYDWDPNNPVTKCWIHVAKGTLLDAPGVTHCELTTRGVDCQHANCVPSEWDCKDNTNRHGGVPGQLNTASEDDCKNQCEAMPMSGCVSIDWDPNNKENKTCWLHPSTAPTDLYAAPGVRHCKITKRGQSCSSGCILTVHVEPEDSAQTVQYVKVVPTIKDLNCLEFTSNGEDATAFTVSDCPNDVVEQIKSDVGCVRFSDVNGHYVRGMPNGRLCIMQTPDTLLFPFNMHTSFNKTVKGKTTYDDSYVDYFHLNSVILGNFFINPDSAEAAVGFTPDIPVKFWKCTPGRVASLPPVPDKCPNVWSKIDHAKPRDYTEGTYDECRKTAIDKGAPGVSINKCADPTTCHFADKNTYLEHNFNTTYYDRWNPYPHGTCPRGCSYWWKHCANVSAPDCWSADPVYLSKTRKEDNLYKCQEYCVNHSPPCVGVHYNNDTKDCKLLAATQIDGQFPSNTANVWQLVPIYTGCGRCISSIGRFCGYNDTTAESTVAVSSDDECLTVCLNNPKCLGYIVRGGTCFITILKNFTLNYVENSDLVYNAVYRSPCGNGCMHRWHFYRGIKPDGFEGAKNLTDVTTERECRFECIADQDCTGIHWIIDINYCILVSGNRPCKYCKPHDNYNCFELIRNDDCEAGEYCGHDQ